MMTNQQALQRLKSDILMRGLSPSTQKVYLRQVRLFLEQSKRPIEELDETDARSYLERMVAESGLAPKTINQYVCAIRFFFAVTLNRYMNYLQFPHMKVPKKLPGIMTRDEVAQLISRTVNVKHRALLLIAYGSGLRINELAVLKTADIDSKSMRVSVHLGKGQKDRYTILSESALHTLRDYWRAYRPKSPEGYLFPGSKNIGHISDDAVYHAVKLAASRAGITANVTPHTLRHCFATHLLEDGYSLLQIKEMLGHASIQSTMIYLRLSNNTSDVTSPADNLPEMCEDCAYD